MLYILYIGCTQIDFKIRRCLHLAIKSTNSVCTFEVTGQTWTSRVSLINIIRIVTKTLQFSNEAKQAVDLKERVPLIAKISRGNNAHTICNWRQLYYLLLFSLTLSSIPLLNCAFF